MSFCYPDSFNANIIIPPTTEKEVFALDVFKLIKQPETGKKYEDYFDKAALALAKIALASAGEKSKRNPENSIITPAVCILVTKTNIFRILSSDQKRFSVFKPTGNTEIKISTNLFSDDYLNPSYDWATEVLNLEDKPFFAKKFKDLFSQKVEELLSPRTAVEIILQENNNRCFANFYAP